MADPPSRSASDAFEPEWAARFSDFFCRLIPHNAALGLDIVDLGPARARIRLPYRDDLVGNPETGVLHGGAITSLLDATCGASVFMKRMIPLNMATLDLRIDYLKPATPGRDVIADTECYKLTRNVAFVRGTAYHDVPDDPIAACAGTFLIFPSKSSRRSTEDRGEASPDDDQLSQISGQGVDS